MPLSGARRGSLGGQGYVYEYSARFTSLVFLLVSGWLAPTASYRNRIMITEVITRATGACRRQMCAGPYEGGEVEKYENGGAPWAYNSALDNFVGTALFGIAVNEKRDNAGMLQARVAGAAPNVGEYHYAFPSDCLPWSTRDGSFVIDSAVPPDFVVETRETLVNEWSALGRAYARGVRGGHARWVPDVRPAWPAAASTATVCF